MTDNHYANASEIQAYAFLRRIAVEGFENDENASTIVMSYMGDLTNIFLSLHNQLESLKVHERIDALEEAARVLDRRASEENARSDRLRHSQQYKAREAAHVARIATFDATSIRNLKELKS